jgi:hypothetical protein
MELLNAQRPRNEIREERKIKKAKASEPGAPSDIVRAKLEAYRQKLLVENQA